MSTFPTDAEREAIWRYVSAVCCDVTQAVKAAERIQDALAPLVADRERAAAAQALHDAAQALDDMQTPSNEELNRVRRDPALWLTLRADELEAGEDRG